MVKYNDNKDINKLRNIFGNVYIALSIIDELNSNYEELKSQKENLLKKIINFISSSSLNKVMSIETWQLDLLLLETPNQETKNSDFKYYTYYSFKELDFIKLLKSISQNKNILSSEEYNLLYNFIPNKKAIEDMLTNSGDNFLIVNPFIAGIIYRLIINRHITVGHTIKAYERLCHNLDFTKYQTGPELELKPIDNR